MRIAFLGPAYPFRGGIAKFGQMLADEFCKNHTVKFFNFKKQYPKIIFPGKEQIEHSEHKANFEIESQLIPYVPATWNTTVKSIKNWQPDVLIINYWLPFFAPAFGYIAKKLRKKMKIYFIPHNIDFHEKWLFADQFNKYALKNADKIVTLSKVVFDDASKLFPQKKIISAFHPIYNCFNFGKYTPQTAKTKLQLTDKKVILFFGYIKPYKGLDILLEAFAKIIKTIDNAHLLIVGEVYGTDKLYQKIIMENQLENEVTFINRFVTNEEIELFFKAADVLALPYKKATQSGVMQIAYDMNLGVVATPVGGLPEFIEHTGIVANSCEVGDFENAILQYFYLDKTELDINIEKIKQKYAWKTLADLILE